MADLFASDVKTASLTVEIKSLHVGTKQMTLSVFRQIHEEDLLDKDFKLLGKPWGLINYWWDKCPQWNPSCIHVIWQKGNELRRFRRSNIRESIKHSDVSEPYSHHEGMIKNNIIGKLHGEMEKINIFLDGGSITINAEEIKSPKYYEKDGVYEAPYSTNIDEWKEKRNSEREKSYKKSLEIFQRCELKKKELQPLLEAKISEANLYLDNWRKSYAELAALPQLYIAA
jgi:hypothetical protein